MSRTGAQADLRDNPARMHGWVRGGKLRRGPVKFVLIHHAACDARVHYRISGSGETVALLNESERATHANSIEIGLDGSFSESPPDKRQTDVLKDLLLTLKQRYPDVAVGGHRQVRGSRTDCPGRKFPLKALLAWSRSGLIEARDAALQEEVDRQYRP